MRHLVQILAGQVEHPRRRLHGDDAQAQHIAEIAQAAEIDRADAARTAGDEAADRRGVVGRGMQPELLAGMGAGRAVDVGEDGARPADDAAGRDRRDLVHLGKAEHDAAGQRHGLAVIAGAGAARRDRNAVPVAGGEHADHFRLALRRDDKVGGDMVELPLQHRAVPVEVAALLLHDLVVVLDLQAVEVALQRSNIHRITPSDRRVRHSPECPGRSPCRRGRRCDPIRAATAIPSSFGP